MTPLIKLRRETPLSLAPLGLWTSSSIVGSLLAMTWNPNAPHCNVQHPLIGCQTRNFKKYVQKYRTMDGHYSLYGMGVWPSRRTSMDRPLGAKLLLGTVPLRR